MYFHILQDCKLNRQLQEEGLMVEHYGIYEKQVGYSEWDKDVYVVGEQVGTEWVTLEQWVE